VEEGVSQPISKERQRKDNRNEGISAEEEPLMLSKRDRGRSSKRGGKTVERLGSALITKRTGTGLQKGNIEGPIPQRKGK